MATKLKGWRITILQIQFRDQPILRKKTNNLLSYKSCFRRVTLSVSVRYYSTFSGCDFMSELFQYHVIRALRYINFANLISLCSPDKANKLLWCKAAFQLRYTPILGCYAVCQINSYSFSNLNEQIQ